MSQKLELEYRHRFRRGDIVLKMEVDLGELGLFNNRPKVAMREASRIIENYPGSNPIIPNSVDIDIMRRAIERHPKIKGRKFTLESISK